MADISCDCSCTDGDPASVYRTQWRKARKEHLCCECDDPIKVGDKHEYVTACWDGTWDDHRTCKTCVAIRERYCPHGWLFGQLAEIIEECLGFDYREVPEMDEEEAEEAERQKWQRRSA